MKRIFIIILAVTIFSCKNGLPTNSITTESSAKISEPGETTVVFENDTHDFGTVVEGEQRTVSFKFTNTGKEPLIIHEVKPGCGCTTAYYPKEAVPVGKTDSISIVFDSSHLLGTLSRHATVFTNTPEIASVLTFKCEVVAK